MNNLTKQFKHLRQIYKLCNENCSTNDFEYLLNQGYDKDNLYYMYSNKAPLEYVFNNIEKPWSWPHLSNNTTISGPNYLLLQMFKRNILWKLPRELSEICFLYLLSFNNNNNNKYK